MRRSVNSQHGAEAASDPGLDGVASVWPGPPVRAHRDQRGRAVHRMQGVRSAHRAHQAELRPHKARQQAARKVDEVSLPEPKLWLGRTQALQRAHSDEATMWLAGDPLPDGPLNSSTIDSDARTKEYRLRFGMGGFGKLRRVGGTTSIRLYESRDEGVLATAAPRWPRPSRCCN